MEGQSSLIISDSGPMINLAHVDKLYLIAEISPELNVLIPQEILDELKDSKTRMQADELIKSGKMSVLPKNIDKYLDRILPIATQMAYVDFGQSQSSWNPKQHYPEIYVILLAKELDAAFVLLDEDRAIREARRQGLKHLRHDAVLDLACENKLIRPEEVKECLKKLMTERHVRYKKKDLLIKYGVVG